MAHLRFEYLERNNTYKITNRKKEYLGYLKYYKSWKCWIFVPMYDCIFSADCMQEIIDYTKELTKVK
ncbi:hypothetical protein A3K72_00705 [Candidatus Woesearchaeota archaeon RBG_13_36_6]|nr:MAG: hypothetical protein A3K72_00705 [Candidatus Woesearchaeota archaeon RBG_13_36_6]